MLEFLPEKMPETRRLPDFVPAAGATRARVALLAGCVQQVVSPEINLATLRVLSRNGVEVLIPRGQNCCGAILMHIGDLEGARELALQNMMVFPKDIDCILTNAAGCGSGMKEYGYLFKGYADEKRAVELADRVKDVSEFLFELGIRQPNPLPSPLNVAYQDACHLAHAQNITDAPRKLLGSVPNVQLSDIGDADTCCGSAGTYNIDQPEIAEELGRLKVRNILESGGDVLVTGNIGCMVQIENHLQKAGSRIPVYHTMQVLDMAYLNSEFTP